MHSTTQLGTLLGVKMTTASVGSGLCTECYFALLCAKYEKEHLIFAWFCLFFHYLYNQTVVIIRLCPMSLHFGKVNSSCLAFHVILS